MTQIWPDLKNISLDRWDNEIFRNAGLLVHVLRLDKIHPEISGNKWFKLKYYLEKAQKENKKTLTSFGGAYSNHLLALAVASSLYGFHAVGFVRGEEPANPSRMLELFKESGMKLKFLSRNSYSALKKIENPQSGGDNEMLLIPEGGSGELGRKGAAEIMSFVRQDVYTHICVAVGTGTTVAGILNSASDDQQVVGISVLKGTDGYLPVEKSWISEAAKLKNLRIYHDFHFGGYAKYTPDLIEKMNTLFIESGIKTDFVYTGKLFFAVEKLALNKQFPDGSRVLVIHSGGLAGNLSLSHGLLQF